jgi:molybdenum cofactor cytidylyltransferase
VEDQKIAPSLEVIALVLLAAGGSRRLGHPKQLVEIEGRSLLRRATETACSTSCEHVLVIVGAQAERMAVELQGTRAEIVPNPLWERGMGTSIRAGVAAAVSRGASAVLIMLCDQPFVDAALLGTLITGYRAAGVLGAACRYGGKLGVPALLGPTLVAMLANLGDDEGARKVLAQNEASLFVVDAPSADVDVDTEADVARLAARLNA